MSMWCPKCQNITYNKQKCDKCDHVIEDTSKSYDIPKPKKVRILKSKPRQKKETSSFINILDEVVDELLNENKKPIKNNFKESTKKTYEDKKTRGDEYEEYIAEHYRKSGYHVIEHGKEKGVKDGGIDLIAKLDNELLLIQCKDWNENYSHKIDHKDIKVLRIDANDFIEKNPIYKNCEIKLRYTLSGNFLHKSAEKHMEECKEDISYEIIKPKYRKEEISKPIYTKKATKRKRAKENKEIEKIILGIVIIIILFILFPTKKTEKIETYDIDKNIIHTTDNNINLIQQKQQVKIDQYHKDQKIKMDKLRAEHKRQLAQKKAIEDRNKYSEREDAKAVLMMQMQN